jgi:hypothetical protein
MSRHAFRPGQRARPAAPIHRWVDAHAWHASCAPCGWTTARRTREQRDVDADAHEVAHEAGLGR